MRQSGGCSFGTGCSCMCKLYVKWHVRSVWLIKVNLVQNQTKLSRCLMKHDLTHCIWARVWSKLWEAVWEKDMGHSFWGNLCVFIKEVCVCCPFCECWWQSFSTAEECVCFLRRRWAEEKWEAVSGSEQASLYFSLSVFLSAIYSSSPSLV